MPCPSPHAMLPAPVRRFLALFVACAALSGCYQPPRAAHASLQVMADGALLFQGQPVDAAGLEQAVVRLRTQTGMLVVDVTPDPAAPMASIRQVVAAIRSAHARLDFVHPTV